LDPGVFEADCWNSDFREKKLLHLVAASLLLLVIQPHVCDDGFTPAITDPISEVVLEIQR